METKSEYTIERRVETLVTKCTRQDADTIRAAALAARMTVSTYMLLAALDKAERTVVKVGEQS